MHLNLWTGRWTLILSCNFVVIYIISRLAYCFITDFQQYNAFQYAAC
uniref:Uncharacterized protein n=1 Tax=Arundo donax TaxID=35708 RepID=A0A0A9FWS6_ARUDO